MTDKNIKHGKRNSDYWVGSSNAITVETLLSMKRKNYLDLYSQSLKINVTTKYEPYFHTR